RVAGLTLVGLDVNRHDLGPSLRRHFEGVIGWIGHRFFHPFAPPAVVPTRRNRQMARDRAALTAILQGVVAQRRRSADHPADVLQLLIEATDDTGRPLGDDEIVEECTGFLFAGHETTASALTWALYELASNPDAQERVAVEGDRLLADGATPGTAGDLEYTLRVVEEVLRLYPPGIAIVRMARRGTTLGRYSLRRGTVVAIFLYAIHRDPRHWLDPGTFNPDRFLAGEPHASLPFGLGPRQCLGARFATTEACLALATIVSRWRLHLMGPVKPEPRVELALRVDGGLPMQLRRRHPADLGS
ncbi:MAG TPA: cytochrome P450, partial [Acidimicrobiia bacterium]